jgi:hypothetical protein
MSSAELRVVVPEAHYTLFNAQRSGLPEVIVVNDALLSFARIEVFPWHLRVEMEARNLIENGMPSPAESEILFAIGDQVESTVLNGTTGHGSPNAVFLARSTWNETRELMFQVHDPEVTHSALQALLKRGEWERRWSYKLSEDRTWSNAARIFKLFPLAKGHDA